MKTWFYFYMHVWNDAIWLFNSHGSRNILCNIYVHVCFWNTGVCVELHVIVHRASCFYVCEIIILVEKKTLWLNWVAAFCDSLHSLLTPWVEHLLEDWYRSVRIPCSQLWHISWHEWCHVAHCELNALLDAVVSNMLCFLQEGYAAIVTFWYPTTFRTLGIVFCRALNPCI